LSGSLEESPVKGKKAKGRSLKRPERFQWTKRHAPALRDCCRCAPAVEWRSSSTVTSQDPRNHSACLRLLVKNQKEPNCLPDRRIMIYSAAIQQRRQIEAQACDKV